MSKEKINVVMLHGINSNDSLDDLGRLRPFFIGQGINPVMFDYGEVSFLVRNKNEKIAKNLALFLSSLKGKIIVVGYSNGAAITHLATSKYKARIDKAVYINPALDSRIDVPETVKWVDVWYTSSDFIVKLSALRPFHIWGTLGAYGYRGKSKNVTAFDMGKEFDIKSKTHTSTFNRDIIEYFGPLIVKHSLDFKELT